MKKYDWSESDINFLLVNIDKIPLKLISKELGKPYHCVLFKKKKLFSSTDNSDYTKKSWDVCKKYLDTLGWYDLNETKHILLKDNYYKNFYGKSGNRKLIKEDPKLYNSIIHHTKILEDIKDTNSKSFIARIVFILEYNSNLSDIKCECGDVISFKQKFSAHKKYEYKFQPFCVNRQPKYPSDRYFQFKYGDEWETHRDEHVTNMKNKKVLSKEWFIKKYGKEGELKYMDFYTKKINTLFNTNKNLNNKKYSKISQKLFNSIKEDLGENKKIYYAENGGEYFINLTNEEKLKINKFCIRPDFLVDDKIIEFNGDYWHRDTKNADDLRYGFLKNLGYKILVINECEYKKTPDKVLENCLKFIND